MINQNYYIVAYGTWQREAEKIKIVFCYVGVNVQCLVFEIRD
jgi:hypothetical protein